MEKMIVEPWPSPSDLTSISPLVDSTSCFTMVIPSPIPVLFKWAVLYSFS